MSHALVMIVDDDVFERMGASYMFSDAGYRVIEAENADEALQLFEINTDVRLLFTDVTMSGSMSGSDLAGQVAQRWPEASRRERESVSRSPTPTDSALVDDVLDVGCHASRVECQKTLCWKLLASCVGLEAVLIDSMNVVAVLAHEKVGS